MYFFYFFQNTAEHTTSMGRGLKLQPSSTETPCIIKEVIFPVSYKTQLWSLSFSSAWTTSCLGWVFCKAVYCILQLKLNLVQSLENSLDGQLKVIYGDFFRLDPLVTGTVKPPAVCSDKLFEAMGVAAVPWRAGMCMRLHML